MRHTVSRLCRAAGADPLCRYDTTDALQMLAEREWCFLPEDAGKYGGIVGGTGEWGREGWNLHGDDGEGRGMGGEIRSKR